MKQKSKNCCVVIPIYKNTLTLSEEQSLIRALDILGNYKFYFVCSGSFDPSYYINLIDEYDNLNTSIKTFGDFYFSSIQGYNRLLMSTGFYKKFIDFDYLLIYQLDTWVFRDELDFWCSLNFDYIGAPWFSNHNNKNELSTFYGIGNGGLSLRKVASHLKALNHFYRLKSHKAIFQDFLTKKIGYTAIKNLFYNLTIRNYSHNLFTPYITINEDVFWSLIAEKKFKWYKVPDMLTASRFSSEINASLLFEANDNTLPFGCHAWEIYDKDFWKRFIEA